MSVSIVNVTLEEIEVLGITEFSGISIASGKIEQFRRTNNMYAVWYSNSNRWQGWYHETHLLNHVEPNSLFTVHYEKD